MLHVHNRWYNLFSAEGRRWLLANIVGWLLGRDVEPGDKFFEYRGIPQMFLHVFTRHELVRLLAGRRLASGRDHSAGHAAAGTGCDVPGGWAGCEPTAGS